MRLVIAAIIAGAVASAGIGERDEENTEGDSVKPGMPFQLMSNAREDYFRALLPDVESPRISAILQDRRTLLYTDREMPPAYQQWDGALPGVHSPSYNISADGGEPHGNGNREFPWKTTGGGHRSEDMSSVRLLWLPTDENGQTLPVTWYRHRYRGDDQRGYAWIFPVGTVVGECLLMKKPNGEKIAFEVRVRTRTESDWEVDVFRPFPTDRDLADAIQRLRPEWQQSESLASIVEHLNRDDRLEVRYLRDDHDARSFDETSGVDTLPSLEDNELVEELLTSTPFRSCHGVRWAENNEEEVFTSAPTTEADFHIVPSGYRGGFIEVDETSCMRCHETVGKHVRRFDFYRDWYGRIRGSDGIFSFHPFSKGSISYNGYGNSVSMRKELVDAGLLTKFNPEIHTPERYKQLSFLGE